jgi:hypothetical protein
MGDESSAAVTAICGGIRGIRRKTVRISRLWQLGLRRSDRAGALFGSFLVQNRIGDRWATVNGFPTTLVPLEQSHCARQRIEQVLSDS